MGIGTYKKGRRGRLEMSYNKNREEKEKRFVWMTEKRDIEEREERKIWKEAE